jgi:hypothetical protein
VLLSNRLILCFSTFIKESTEIQIRYGMGIKISIIESKPAMNSMNESIPTGRTDAKCTLSYVA